MQIKKKHHYISQFYLREWANDKGEITTFDGKRIDTPSIDTSTGFKNHLYRLTQFSNEQRLLIQQYCILVGYANLSSYSLVIQSIFLTQQHFENADFVTSSLFGNSFKNQQGENLKREFNSNLLEDSFADSESKFQNTLKKIIHNETKSLNLNDYDILMHFITFQLAKTPKKLKKMKEVSSDEIIKIFNFNSQQLEFFNLLMALCIAEQIYLSALTRLDVINIYYNNTQTKFITSDDPSFNQKLLEKELFIQIPITPHIMIELSKNPISKENRGEFLNYLNSQKSNANSIMMLNKVIFTKNINVEDEINTVNQKIFENRDRVVYGLTQYDFGNLKN